MRRERGDREGKKKERGGKRREVTEEGERLGEKKTRKRERRIIFSCYSLYNFGRI